MEKYRSTADPSTGVHPFLPAVDPSPFALRIVLGGPLFLLRLPFLVFGATFTILLTLTAKSISLFSGTLARPFYRTAHAVGLRAVLFGLGIWRLHPPTLDRPRTRDGTAGLHPTHGDAVFCNHASILDPLYLACFYSPVFAVPTETHGVFATLTLQQAVLSTLSRDSTITTGSRTVGTAKRLASISEASYVSSSGPVVVFAEGTTTNGAGVLSFSALGGPPTRPHSHVFALGFRYSPSRCETCTVAAPAAHVVGRMAAVQSTIRAHAINVPADGDLQRNVAVLAGIPPLRLGAEARYRFDEHWQQVSKGY
jgi:Acyltransferase